GGMKRSRILDFGFWISRLGTVQRPKPKTLMRSRLLRNLKPVIQNPKSKIQNLPDLRPLVLLALLGIVVWAVFVLAGGVEFRAFEQRRSDSNTASLGVSSVAQSFRSSRANLSAID